MALQGHLHAACLPLTTPFPRYPPCLPAFSPLAALPVAVEATIAALPHDAHPMGTILTGLCALSTLHPEQARLGRGVNGLPVARVGLHPWFDNHAFTAVHA